MKKWLMKVLGIRTPEEDFAAGVNYVNRQVDLHGNDNQSVMDGLWAECSSTFHRTSFDKGVESRLDELDIHDPASPDLLLPVPKKHARPTLRLV